MLTRLVQAVYRSLLHLNWVDKLVDNIRTIFVSLYGDQLKKPHTTLVECHKFDDYFDQQLQELETTTTRNAVEQPDEAPVPDRLKDGMGPPGLTYRGKVTDKTPIDTTSGESTPIATPSTSRPSTPSSNLLVAKAGPLAKMSRRARKASNQASTMMSSGDESSLKKSKSAGKAVKKGRKWDADGMADEDDYVQLDYSAHGTLTSDSDAEPTARSTAVDPVDSATWGSTKQGKFVLRDLGDEVHSMLASAEAEKKALANQADTKSGLLGSGVNAISGLFRNVVGGKTLTKEDLDKAMKGMEEHLLKKNVAREAAVRLCDGVEKELLGVKTANFESKRSASSFTSNKLRSSSDGHRYRYQHSNPKCHGIIPHQNANPRFFPRSSPRNRLRYLPTSHLPPKTASLRNVHRWRQRRRKIHQPL